MIDVREHYKTTQCEMCPISVGCSSGCIRGDDLAEIYELRLALRRTLEAARIAVDYHRLGYGRASEFDADTMIHLMNKLGRALDDYESAK